MRGIRRRTLWILAAVLTVVFAVAFGISAQVLVMGTREIEHSLSADRAAAASRAFSDLVDNFERTTQHYADWEATWRFVRGEYPEFPVADLTIESMTNLEVDAILVVQGARTLLAVLRQPEPLVFVPVPEELQRAMSAVGQAEGSTALFWWDGDAWALSAGQIHNPSLPAPSAGRLVFGRRLAGRHLERLSSLFGGTVRLRPVVAALQPEDTNPLLSQVPLTTADEPDSWRLEFQLQPSDGSRSRRPSAFWPSTWASSR